VNFLNVLLVTYVFPPAGGVGVLRAASLARYFPAEGIRLDVVTTRNASAVGSDPTLLSEIPSAVIVHRTVTFDLPFGIKKAIKRLVTRTNQPAGNTSRGAGASSSSLLRVALQEMLLPDPQVTWLPVLTRAARRIVRDRNIDMVLITAPPFSNVLLVERLRKQFPDLPIVVEFRDEWLSTAIDLVAFSRSKRARRVAQKSEASSVANATAVVAVTEAARREIRSRYPQEPETKFHLIPNGFDATRLCNSAPSLCSRTDKRIIVTHIGSVYASTEPSYLVRALQSLSPDERSRFRLRFIGYIEEPRFREALLQLGDMVELTGFMPQRDALAFMNQTDYVLLIQHGSLNVAAKFYDYIGGGKPVLATIHPEGPERRLLEELRAGWWADSRDVEGIRRLFLDVVARGNSLQSEFQPDKEKIAQYERKVLAQRYAALLHSIARAHRNTDGQELAGNGVREEI